MENYRKLASTVLSVAETLETDKISVKDISLNELVEEIRDIYRVKCNEGDTFADIYTKLFHDSRDKNEVAVVLRLLAHHIMIFEQDMEQVEALKVYHGVLNKLYVTYTKLGYYLNRDKIRAWHEKHGYEDNIPFRGKGVIYSAITGNYDDVKEPKYISDKFDHILFTNNPEIKSKVWKVILVDNKEGVDDAKLSKRIKIMGHEYLPEYDYSIWIDGNVMIKGDLSEYIEKYRDREPVLCFNHHENNCIYREKETCVMLKKDDPEVMEKQVQRYRLEGFPECYGMTENGVMVRDIHNERVKKVMETWWSEVLNGSKRDQISFGYACWKNDFVYDTSDIVIYDNIYVDLFFHN